MTNSNTNDNENDTTSSKSTKGWKFKLKNVFTRDKRKDTNPTSSSTGDSPTTRSSAGPAMDGGKNVDKVMEERDWKK